MSLWLQLAALSAIGCGGVGPVAPLCAGATCYRLGALDASWRVVKRGKGEVGFFSDVLGGVIQTNAVCREDAEAAPLEALSNRLLIGYSEVVEVSVERVSLGEREALHSVVAAKLDGVPVTLDLYVMKRGECVVDLAYAAPAARFSDGKLLFERFAQALRASERL